VYWINQKEWKNNRKKLKCGSPNNWLTKYNNTIFLRTLKGPYEIYHYSEVLEDKSTMHIRVPLYWVYVIVLWLFRLVCILYCGCVNLFRNVWVSMCGWVFVRVFWQLYGYFGNMCTRIYRVLYFFCCVFLLFHVRLFLFVLSTLE